jgi:hypothetical protein
MFVLLLLDLLLLLAHSCLLGISINFLSRFPLYIYVFVPSIFLQAHFILQVYGLMALFFEIICVLEEMLLSIVNLHVNCLESDCILRGRLYLAIVVSIPLIYIVDLQLNKFPCNFWAKSCGILPSC